MACSSRCFTFLLMKNLTVHSFERMALKILALGETPGETKVGEKWPEKQIYGYANECNGMIYNHLQRVRKISEVASGFEPLYEVLQTSA
jgi:hypothetical protein